MGSQCYEPSRLYSRVGDSLNNLSAEQTADGRRGLQLCLLDGPLDTRGPCGGGALVRVIGILGFLTKKMAAEARGWSGCVIFAPPSTFLFPSAQHVPP